MNTPEDISNIAAMFVFSATDAERKNVAQPEAR